MANVINMGGGGANVQSKTVKSTTSKQTLTPPSGVDGFSPVIVSPMVLQEKTVTLSTAQQVLTPPSGVDGFSKVTVPAAGDYFVDVILEGSFTVGESGKQVTLPLSHSPAGLRDSIVLVQTFSNEAGAIVDAGLIYSNGYGTFSNNGAVLTTSDNNIAAIISLPTITGTISGSNFILSIASGTVSGYSPIFGVYGRIVVIYKG